MKLKKIKLRFWRHFCPTCGVAYTKHSSRARSRDHIMPKAWGGANYIYGDVLNVRHLCRSCNELRGQMGHCVGALACVIHVSQQTKENPNALTERWGMRKLDPIRIWSKARRMKIVEGCLDGI